MLGYNNQDEEDAIPPLQPLKKKKIQNNPVATPSEKNSISNDALNNIIKDSIRTPTSQISKDAQKNFTQAKKQANPEKIQQISDKHKQKISTMQKRDNQYNKIQNEHIKENEKMKSLIAQILNTISVKNTAEELYPISNEVMDSLIAKIEEEIENLTNQSEKKQSTLTANPNNLHTKNELASIQRQLNHCSLIKTLYYEKMNYRNKIRILEEKILILENENNDLKKKVVRGIETVENYKQNQPYERQKQLNEKLSTCKDELALEKEMRQNLQKNIEGIIMNFKRLYEQADLARQIVTKKLREVEEREKQMKKMKIQPQQQYNEDANATARRGASLQVTEQKKQPANLHNIQSDYAQTNQRKASEMDNRKSTYRLKTTSIPTRQKQQKDKKSTDPNLNTSSVNLEDKIKKMKSNQNAFTKAFPN